MSNKRKPIIVTIKEEKHPTQPWVFDIDKPGPAKKETKKERYTRRGGARLGALRQLDAEKFGGGGYFCMFKGRITNIEFIYIKRGK